MKKYQLLANNKKARHEYFVEDTFEAGIVLTGTEIKSLRQGKVSIKESYGRIIKGEVFVMSMNISPYEQGNIFNPDPLRPRKLLLHRKEIEKLSFKLAAQGMTLVPLKVYINEDGRAKVELGLCRGKKNYDKRADIAAKDARRKIERQMKNRY